MPGDWPEPLGEHDDPYSAGIQELRAKHEQEILSLEAHQAELQAMMLQKHEAEKTQLLERQQKEEHKWLEQYEQSHQGTQTENQDMRPNSNRNTIYITTDEGRFRVSNAPEHQHHMAAGHQVASVLEHLFGRHSQMAAAPEDYRLVPEYPQETTAPEDHFMAGGHPQMATAPEDDYEVNAGHQMHAAPEDYHMANAGHQMHAAPHGYDMHGAHAQAYGGAMRQAAPKKTWLEKLLPSREHLRQPKKGGRAAYEGQGHHFMAGGHPHMAPNGYAGYEGY